VIQNEMQAKHFFLTSEKLQERAIGAGKQCTDSFLEKFIKIDFLKIQMILLLLKICCLSIGK
jgi:hypothetical protein